MQRVHSLGQTRHMFRLLQGPGRPRHANRKGTARICEIRYGGIVRELKEKLRPCCKKSRHGVHVVMAAGRDRIGSAMKSQAAGPGATCGLLQLGAQSRPFHPLQSDPIRMSFFRQAARAIGASALASLIAASPVMAAAPASKGPCYTVPEFAAEQGIRLHTELMVIGLTCQHLDAPGQVSLFNQYKQFTLKHQTRIQEWEKTLVGYFKRTTKGNATRGFDSFRTRLANETSQRAIALTTPVFCGTHAPLVAQAMAASLAEIESGLSPDATGVRVANAPRCDKPAPTVLMADAAAAANAAPPRAPSAGVSGAAAGAKPKVKSKAE